MASPTDSMTERPMMNDNMGTEQDNNTNGSGAMSDTSVAREEKTPDPKPAASVDGGYGWVCVFATFLINCHTFGINSSFGVFLAYYIENDKFPGATNLQYAFIGGLSISCALLISPLVTYITRTFGTKYTLGLGVILETISFIGASFASRTWHLFLSQGICFGFGMGLLFLGSVGIIPQWFVKRRGLANALGSSGSGIGGLVYNLAVQAMLKSVGLAWTFRILAIIVFVTCVFSTIIIRDRNKAIGASQMVFDVTLFKRVEYLMILAWGFLSILGLIVLLFSLPNYANYIGLTPNQGAVVGAVLNLGQGIGRPIVGFASDKTGRMNGAGFFTFLTGLFCLVVWIFAKSYGVLIFFALIVGLVCGTFWATIAPVAAEIVGLKHLASALSINWLVLVAPATVSEAIALQLSSTGYLHAQIYVGFIYIGAALFIWPLRAWKLGQMEMAAAEQGKTLREVDAMQVNGTNAATTGATPSSSFVRRLFIWKKV